MEDQNSDEWLPPGWTVEVRVRKNGKRDKYYFPPSSGHKFNSKVEVLRHLDNDQNKTSDQKIPNNVAVEKGIAEGLPPGWMKRTRITTKGETVRRDSYFIDPVSGYTFRSIKDVDRYLESGEVGRNAFKPKDSDTELKAGKSPSASVTMKPTLSVSMGQSSDLDIVANDQQVSTAANSGEYTPMSIPERISNHGVVGTELTSSILSGAESSDQKEAKIGLARGNLVSVCTDEDTQEKQLQENSETKHVTDEAQAQTRRRKNKRKIEINLPRRASKRLAGIKVDHVPELVTRNRARRVAVKQSNEEEAMTNVDKSPNSLPDGLAEQFNALEGGLEVKCQSEKNTEKTLEAHRSHKDKESFSSCLPMENNATETVDFPLKELLTDPCIAFAIQTLTGETFETSKTSETSFELRNSQYSETSAAAEGHGKKNNDGSDDIVFSSPANFAIPQEHAGNAKTVDKANNENAGPSSEKTLDMSWMDPCIEFAIKTLTGTIPIDSDQNPKNCLQQQLSSSNTQHSDLSSVSLDNLYQSDYFCSQYFDPQKPMFQQSFVDPTLQHTKNIGMGNSAGARLPHRDEDNRRNVC